MTINLEPWLVCLVQPLIIKILCQGQTVSKPNSLVVDVTSAHQPGMVYVMLSRGCSLDQLTILDQMNPDKIHVNADVEAEAKRMEKWLNKL